MQPPHRARCLAPSSDNHVGKKSLVFWFRRLAGPLAIGPITQKAWSNFAWHAQIHGTALEVAEVLRSFYLSRLHSACAPQIITKKSSCGQGSARKLAAIARIAGLGSKLRLLVNLGNLLLLRMTPTPPKKKEHTNTAPLCGSSLFVMTYHNIIIQ